MNKIRTRTELLEYLPKKSIGAEIGVFEGSFSQDILNIVNPCKLYLVDIFSGETGSGDVHGKNMRIINLDKAYQNLLEKYSNNKSVSLYKGYSKSFFESIENEYLDFVYIDADHSYQAVKNDLEYAKLKVKRNGFICGHDYAKSSKGCVKAVNEFCNNYKLDLVLTTDDGCNSYLIINK